MSHLGIIIATRNRAKLLERTLQSLAECAIPPALRRIIVAENGADSHAEALVTPFRSRLPIEYRHYPESNKCGALNRAIAELHDELIIFLDDDVRLHKDTLVAYTDAAAGHGPGAFFGGRCLADYDEPPDAWLVPYLPNSAKGWSLGKEVCELREPKALGFNWAAYAVDLRAVGCFDERSGPGTGGNGDESLVQEKLLRRGIKGYFLPAAMVWHYVPRERCSAEWALKRRRETAIGEVARADNRWSKRWARQIACRLKIAFYSAVLRVGHDRFHPKTLFHYRYRIQGLRGRLDGIKRVSASLGSPHSPAGAIPIST